MEFLGLNKKIANSKYPIMLPARAEYEMLALQASRHRRQQPARNVIDQPKRYKEKINISSRRGSIYPNLPRLRKQFIGHVCRHEYSNTMP